MLQKFIGPVYRLSPLILGKPLRVESSEHHEGIGNLWPGGLLSSSGFANLIFLANPNMPKTRHILQSEPFPHEKGRQGAGKLRGP